MFLSVARFEAGYQLRNPVLWVSFILFFLMTFGATTSEFISFGDTANIHKNAPFTIAQAVVIFGILSLFAVTAFVANAVTRDDETGYGPILRATRLGKASYLYGRFLGAMIATAVGFLAVPLGVLVGSFMPWVNKEALGPTVLWYYAFAYAVLGIPMLTVFAAMLFTLATATRSMMGAYLGLIAIIVGWVVAGTVLTRPEQENLSALIDPTGSGAIFQQTKYWTAADRNTRMIEISGLFLLNRTLWAGVAIACLAAAWMLYRPEAKGAKTSRKVKASKRGEAAVTTQTAPLRNATFDSRARGAQLWARTVFDVKAVMTSPAFFVLLLLGLFNAGGALWFADEIRGTAIEPVTRLMVTTLNGAYAFIPIIIAAYYAGDLVWRDRERRMHEIIDSTPVLDWAFVLPKVLAIFLVLVSTAVIGMVAGMTVQTIKGYTNYEPVNYLFWWIIPLTISAGQLAVLAVFFQAISPNKYVGWALILVYLIASITMGSLGLQHNLYNFGGSPGTPLSAFNGLAHFWIGRTWFDLYWGAFCTILVILAYGLWRRGSETRLVPRLARMPRRMSGLTGTALAAAVIAFAGLGGWIFYNTTMLNTYQSSVDREKVQADMERTLSQYETMPGPTITDVTLEVELDTNKRTANTRGAYVIENRTGAPLERMMVVWPETLAVNAFEVPGGRVEQDWKQFRAAMWRFDVAMAPGETRTLTFDTTLGKPGFTNGAGLTRIVDNGTFIDNTEITPILGIMQAFWIQDRSVRRRNGLEAERRPAKLEDASANGSHYLRPDSDWVTARITVTTDDDQIPIAPGYQVSETRADGRITRRFETEAPIHHFFSIQSARYGVWTGEAKTVAGPIRLEIYHHPEHTRNLERMQKAMVASLQIFSERFSPFQFRQMRILEFPAYATFAQSFANTVPFSEDIGWLQANRDPKKTDLVTFVTAHEIAHQWWAHQVIGADKQGATVLSETFSQYGALLVMDELLGPEHVRQFLKNELDAYLRARGGEAVEELPLIRVENQGYIHYNKGALVMYFLRNEVGEAAVNRALQRLIQEYAFKAAPYPSSADFVRMLREEAGPQHDQLITDLFERITLYDAKTTIATRRKLDDGRWEVRLTIEAKKLYADGQGVETEAPLDEPFEIGVFRTRPEDVKFDRADVLAFERRPLRSGKQEVVLIVAAGPEPMFAGIDPYVKRVDRNADDNLTAVTAAPAS